MGSSNFDDDAMSVSSASYLFIRRAANGVKARDQPLRQGAANNGREPIL